MYEVTIQGHFDSAHYLRSYQGKCENIHGHRWMTEVTIKTSDIDHIGLAFDFQLLKQKVKLILDELDHCILNEQNPFREENPSTENIARYIYRTIQKDLPNNSISLAKVRVYESPDSWVTYYE